MLLTGGYGVLGGHCWYGYLQPLFCKLSGVEHSFLCHYQPLLLDYNDFSLETGCEGLLCLYDHACQGLYVPSACVLGCL